MKKIILISFLFLMGNFNLSSWADENFNPNTISDGAQFFFSGENPAVAYLCTTEDVTLKFQKLERVPGRGKVQVDDGETTIQVGQEIPLQTMEESGFDVFNKNIFVSVSMSDNVQFCDTEDGTCKTLSTITGSGSFTPYIIFEPSGTVENPCIQGQTVFQTYQFRNIPNSEFSLQVTQIVAADPGIDPPLEDKGSGGSSGGGCSLKANSSYSPVSFLVLLGMFLGLRFVKRF